LILISVDPVVPVIIYPVAAFELTLNVINANDSVPAVIENFPKSSINNSDYISVV
jgi:hypothetical protein